MLKILILSHWYTSTKYQYFKWRGTSERKISRISLEGNILYVPLFFSKNNQQAYPTWYLLVPSQWFKYHNNHCVKRVQIRSFFRSIFPRIRTEYGYLLHKSPYSVRMQENTEQKKLRIWMLYMKWMFKLYSKLPIKSQQQHH